MEESDQLRGKLADRDAEVMRARGEKVKAERGASELAAQLEKARGEVEECKRQAKEHERMMEEQACFCHPITTTISITPSPLM